VKVHQLLAVLPCLRVIVVVVFELDDLAAVASLACIVELAAISEQRLPLAILVVLVVARHLAVYLVQARM